MPEETTTEVMPWDQPARAQSGTYRCTYTGCGAVFSKPQALRMHTVRMHTHRKKSEFSRLHKTRQQQEAHKRELKRASNARMRARYKAMGLTGTGKPRKNRPNAPRGSVPFHKTKEYRQQKYHEQVKRYHDQGLNAHGNPFKRPAGKSRPPLSPQGLRNILTSQRKRRLREAREKRQLLNGAVTPPEPQPAETDNMGETARAIIMAAQVLRSVSLGLKL